MKNITVKEFIEKLKICNQDAVMCVAYPDDNKTEYSSIEIMNELETYYIDDSGDEVFGKIVSVYG